jgi:transmembrane sensor
LKEEKQDLLISRYLANEASEEESKELFQWIESSPEHRKHFDIMLSLWKETIVKDRVNNHQNVYEKLRAEMFRYGSQQKPALRSKKSKGWLYSSVVAASLTAFFLTAYFLHPTSNPTVEQADIVDLDIIKSNPMGQKSRIFLPDGSNVWLNAESTIKYGQNFGDSARNIFLTGEAYFEVAKGPKSFIVQSGDVSITAFGTSFNVAAYPNDENITIALIEGKVLISKGELDEVLNPDELLVIGNYDNKGYKYSGKAFEFSAWKDGILTFKAEPLSQIIPKIERWYGVEVVVEGLPDAGLRFTGRFHNEYLSNVLESMSYGQNMQYQIMNKKVKLIFK